jgi:glutamate racemase
LIGVFDSGIGGLSVLRALRAQLPAQRFTYIADGDNAPYGERDEAFVVERSMAITHELVTAHGARLVVVACNTATAAAVHVLRKEFPAVPFVGIEPALKPAVLATRNGRIGVMATRGTLASAKFAALLRSVEGQAEFVLQPCDGLAHAIEVGDAANVRSLCESYWKAIRARADVDTLVLGCTHYPLEEDVLREVTGVNVTLIEPGPAVARRVQQLRAAQPLFQ